LTPLKVTDFAVPASLVMMLFHVPKGAIVSMAVIFAVFEMVENPEEVDKNRDWARLLLLVPVMTLCWVIGTGSACAALACRKTNIARERLRAAINWDL
jgi:hypothetical protein